MVIRVVAGSLACAHHFKSTRSGPVNVFTHKGWLVTPGQAIDDASCGGFTGQQGSGNNVGFDAYHDHVMAGMDGTTAVFDPGTGNAGGLDNDVQALIGNECRSVVADVRRA